MSLVRGFDPQAQQLLAHVRSGANPDARLALAAHLRTSDAADEHAELIVLTQQLGLSPDTSRARRCLDLLSSIGLGWLDNDDEACIGPARGGGCYPVQYELPVDSFLYYVRYRHGGLSISDAIEMMVHFYDNDYPCLRDRTQAAGGAWTDEETNVLLFEISNALRMQKPHQQLPPDWQVERRGAILMHEEMMRVAGVAPREVPVLELGSDDGRRAILEPRGLWIIGTNGRIDLLVGSRHFLLFDRAKNFAAPDWRIDDFHARKGLEKLDKTRLTTALAR